MLIFRSLFDGFIFSFSFLIKTPFHVEKGREGTTKHPCLLLLQSPKYKFMTLPNPHLNQKVGQPLFYNQKKYIYKFMIPATTSKREKKKHKEKVRHERYLLRLVTEKRKKEKRESKTRREPLTTKGNDLWGTLYRPPPFSFFFLY
jgi:hypothetical protein